MTQLTARHDSVLYQIYPRSFCDSNGDGVGDLPGVTSKLDYLKDLGVNVIWLSPFYPSPMDDLGYDITDYCNVDPLFGSLDDFKRLLAQAHRRGLRVLIDLVPNHTSTEHPWFLDAVSSRDSKKRDWYVWKNPRADGSPPNNWQNAFGGSAWQLDKASGQYYLHSFLTSQADLNWANPAVREAIKDVMRFWLDLGVDGFRVDAANYLAKDPDFNDDPPNPNYHPGAVGLDGNEFLPKNSQLGPKVFEYLQEVANVLKQYDGCFMVTEAYADDGEAPVKYYTQFYKYVDPSVSAPFDFRPIFLPWQAGAFADFIGKFQGGMHPDYVPVYCFGDHDQPRLVGRVGQQAARTAAMLAMSLPGMPMIYYGDEIGMENGGSGDTSGHSDLDSMRYPARTPMQWSAAEKAGFSNGEPWLPINENYQKINVANELADDDSLLNLYRRLLAFRAGSMALRHGNYELLDLDNSDVFAFTREYKNEKLAVILNFSNEPQNVEVDFTGMAVSTHLRPAGFPGKLEPNEGLILTLS